MPPAVSPAHILKCSGDRFHGEQNMFMESVHYGESRQRRTEHLYVPATAAADAGTIAQEQSGNNTAIKGQQAMVGTVNDSYVDHKSSSNDSSRTSVQSKCYSPAYNSGGDTGDESIVDENGDFIPGDDGDNSDDDKSVQFDLDFVLSATNSLMELEEQERKQQQEQQQQQQQHANVVSESNDSSLHGEDGLRDGDLAFVSSSATSSPASFEQYYSDNQPETPSTTAHQSIDINNKRQVPHYTEDEMSHCAPIPTLAPPAFLTDMRQDMIDIEETTQRFFQDHYATCQKLRRRHHQPPSTEKRPLCLFVNFMGTRVRPEQQASSSSSSRPAAKRRKTF